MKQGGRRGGASEMELRFWGNVPSVQGAKQKAWGQNRQEWGRLLEGWDYQVAFHSCS